MFKVKHGLASESFESMFVVNSSSNLSSVYQKSILNILEK